MQLNLYLITDPSATGYDVWDHWVVTAKTRRRALAMSPNRMSPMPDNATAAWAPNATALFLGKASISLHEPEVLCASFNAG